MPNPPKYNELSTPEVERLLNPHFEALYAMGELDDTLDTCWVIAYEVGTDEVGDIRDHAFDFLERKRCLADASYIPTLKLDICW